jgi:hypothetical protein
MFFSRDCIRPVSYVCFDTSFMCGDGVDFPFRSLLSYQSSTREQENERQQREPEDKRGSISRVIRWTLDPHRMGSGEECGGGPFPRLLLGSRTSSSSSSSSRTSNTRRITRSSSSTVIAARIGVSLLWGLFRSVV